MKSYYAGMAGVGFEQARKKYIYSRFKPNRRHTHNALDDALEQAELFENLLKFNENRTNASP